MKQVQVLGDKEVKRVLADATYSAMTSPNDIASTGMPCGALNSIS